MERGDIEKAAKAALGDEIKKISQVQSNVNHIFNITLNNGQERILRIFSDPWKARKEEFVYSEIRRHTTVPVPEIFFIDDSMEKSPFAYSILSKLPGIPLDKAYHKGDDASLFEKAGEMLAQIHTIRYPQFGWIVGNEIMPAFDNWKEFCWHDIRFKRDRLSSLKPVQSLRPKIDTFLNQYSYLLEIEDKPCLLHKDYHCSHILVDKGAISGIIDIEWAIAGHSENDLIKMELWDFPRMKPAMKSVRDAFYNGYLRHGLISADYPERKKLYELMHHISMVNISFEIKNKVWLKKNVASLIKFLANV